MIWSDNGISLGRCSPRRSNFHLELSRGLFHRAGHNRTASSKYAWVKKLFLVKYFTNRSIISFCVNPSFSRFLFIGPRMNRILDGSHGGDRSQLMLAVAAHNAMPTRKHGISPEAIWRASKADGSTRLCKAFSAISRQTYLLRSRIASLALMLPLTTDDYKQAIATFETKMQPMQEALQDQHVRSALAQQLKYQRKKTRASAMPLLSGDRVIV